MRQPAREFRFQLDLSSGDGRVDARALPGSKAAGDWNIHTGDGSVTLQVPDGFSANVSLHTGDGRIDLDMPVSVEGKLSHWVVAFSDRGEIERLRLEVESLKGLAASSLGLRQGGQPARGAQQSRVEIPAADELHAERHPGRIL